MPKPYWTKELVLQAFHEWERTHGSPPKMEDWRTLTPEARENLTYTTNRTVHRLFGGWPNAMAEYEKWHLPPRPQEHWTKASIIAAIQQWADEHEGNAPVFKEIGDGRNRSLPAPNTVERLFGTWPKALAEAGFFPRSQGITRKAVNRFKPLPRRR